MTTHFEAWVMLPDDQVVDTKLENRLTPNVPVSMEQLHTLGLWHQAYDASTMCLPAADGGASPIDRIAAAMGYKNRDEVFIAPDKMPNYAEKVKMFYEEHIHEDDEIRLVLKGGGYFDVRGHGDEWIRIRVTPGDFLVLPAGIYHRYGVDESEFAHVMRLFAEAPRWVAVPRPCEDNEIRAAYRLKHLRPGGPVPQTALGPCQPEAHTYHIQHPSGADDTLAPVLRDVASGRTECAVVYITGAHNPNTHQSWCPDCVTADPVVKAQVTAAREKCTRPVAFVHATVQRTSYLRNPAYPLRQHPILRVRAIPTVLVLKPEGDGVNVVVSERLDGDVPESWVMQL